MTGWRCGWALGPADVIAACNALQSHSTSNVCSISQKAAVAALRDRRTRSPPCLPSTAARRDQLHAWLTADPRITCVKPAGAFYLFIDISALLSPDGIRTSAEFARALLDESHVALTAGEAFDAPGFLRISYATSMERLREGATRILEFVEKLDASGQTPGGVTGVTDFWFSRPRSSFVARRLSAASHAEASSTLEDPPGPSVRR